jgi:cell division protein FtsL
MRLKIRNLWQILLVTFSCAFFTYAGIRHIESVRTPLLVRQALFEEITKRKALIEEKKRLDEELYSLKAFPRVLLRARDLLGMRPVTPDDKVIIRSSEP